MQGFWCLPYTSTFVSNARMSSVNLLLMYAVGKRAFTEVGASAKSHVTFASDPVANSSRLALAQARHYCGICPRCIPENLDETSFCDLDF